MSRETVDGEQAICKPGSEAEQREGSSPGGVYLLRGCSWEGRTGNQAVRLVNECGGIGRWWNRPRREDKRTGERQSPPSSPRVKYGSGFGSTRKPALPHVLDDRLTLSLVPAGEHLNNCEGDGEGG